MEQFLVGQLTVAGRDLVRAKPQSRYCMETVVLRVQTRGHIVTPVWATTIL